MSISKSYNKQNDTTYVYEVIENYWDKEKKQPRSKRKLIGKIDRETGEIVPTTPRKKSRDNNDVNYKKLYESLKEEIASKDRRIAELEDSIREYLTEEMKVLKETASASSSLYNKAESLLHEVSSHD